MALLASVSLGAWVSATPGFGHPTEQELRAAFAERAECEAEPASAERIDPIRLGMSESELRAAHADVHRDATPPSSPNETTDATATPGREVGDLARWVREGTDDVVLFEYELWQDRVYRIRWRLSEAFERPVLDEFVRRAKVCFGPPEFDQLFEAEPGSPRATLRRVGWKHGDRRIELRQLHPLGGGPVYLTLTRTAVLREIAASGVIPYPDPDRSEPWWKRSMRAPKPATGEERRRLGDRFAALLARMDH